MILSRVEESEASPALAMCGRKSLLDHNATSVIIRYQLQVRKGRFPSKNFLIIEGQSHGQGRRDGDDVL